MEPRRITPLDQSPVNRLFFAINHYVSTGDRFGEGMALDEGRKLRFLVPVNRAMAGDADDFEAFRSRFDELAEKYETSLEHMGREGLMEMWSFAVHAGDLDDLARELRERPGEKGWGSPKAIIDQHNWTE